MDESKLKQATEAKIFCSDDFGLDDYCVFVKGIYYRRNKNNKLVQIPELPVGVFPQELPLALILEGDEPDLDKLKDAADKQLTEHKPKVKISGLRTASAPVKEKAESFAPHVLLAKYESVINQHLTVSHSRFQFDEISHSLRDPATEFKITFQEDGSTQSDLYTDLDDKNLVKDLVEIQLAVVRTLQILLRETQGAYPKGLTNLYVIKEGLAPDEEKKANEIIIPVFKNSLKAELLKPEFDNIRKLLQVEHEAVVEAKKQEEKPAHPQTAESNFAL